MLLTKRGCPDVQRRHEDRQLPGVIAAQPSPFVEHSDRVLPGTVNEIGQRQFDAPIPLAAIVLERVQLPFGGRDLWRLPTDDSLFSIEHPQIAMLVGEATEVRLWQEVMELRLVGQDSDPLPLSRQRCSSDKLPAAFRRHRLTYGTYESLLSVDCRTRNE